MSAQNLQQPALSSEPLVTIFIYTTARASGLPCLLVSMYRKEKRKERSTSTVYLTLVLSCIHTSHHFFRVLLYCKKQDFLSLYYSRRDRTRVIHSSHLFLRTLYLSTMASKILLKKVTARVFTSRSGAGGNPVSVFLSKTRLSRSISAKLAQECDWESVVVTHDPTVANANPTLAFFYTVLSKRMKRVPRPSILSSLIPRLSRIKWPLSIKTIQWGFT